MHTVTHLVFFKMAAEDAETAEQDAERLVKLLQELPSKIPELQALEAGADISRTPASWTVGLYTRFADREGLETYRVHPAHQEVIKFVQQVTSDRAVVDFESAED